MSHANVMCIEACCGRGHVQKITVIGMGREYAEWLAGLLDGSSPLYIIRPGPESEVGKCGLCGSPLTCQVQEGRPGPTGEGADF